MRDDEFNYIDETVKKKSKAPLIIIIILLIIGAALALYFLVLPNIKHDKKSDNKQVEVETGDKILDVASGLLIPKKYSEEIFSEQKVTITTKSIQADKTGYNIEVTIKNERNDSITMDIDMILIDGFETTADFKTTVEPFQEKDAKFNISKTELDLLEINDFNSIRLLGKLKYDKNPEGMDVDASIMAENYKPANNAKNKIEFDRLDYLSLSVYKKSTDAEYTYIYFDMVNDSKYDNFEIYVNKVSIDDKVVNFDDFKETLHYKGEKIFYLRIPKKDFPTIEKMEVSFFFIKDKGKPTQLIKTSNLKEINIDKI